MLPLPAPCTSWCWRTAAISPASRLPVTCAGVRVNAGDIITADEDGVAVVPKARAADVLKKAQDLDDTEHRMIPFIEKFKSIKEAVAKFGRI